MANPFDLSGRVAVVTGANTGIGYHTAAALAYRGAHVVLAVRDLEKGNTALSRIHAASPRADVTLQALDLTSLESVRAAADALRAAYPRLDFEVNQGPASSLLDDAVTVTFQQCGM